MFLMESARLGGGLRRSAGAREEDGAVSFVGDGFEKSAHLVLDEEGDEAAEALPIPNVVVPSLRKKT
jgi:hypothetical protein